MPGRRGISARARSQLKKTAACRNHRKELSAAEALTRTSWIATLVGANLEVHLEKPLGAA